MVKVEEIYAGWKNYAFKNSKIEKLAKDRTEICVKCTKLRRNKTCRICGCYVPAKVRSPKSKCPIRKW